jgi:hypothetical protein
MNQLLKSTLISIFCLNFSGLMAQTEFQSSNSTKDERKSNYFSGYIITSENDTLKGFIEKQSDKKNSKRCNFKQSLSAEVTEYFPEDLKEYRFDDDKYYVSKTILLRRKEVNLFLELLVDGTADLYFFREDNITDHYFIQKADGKFFELTKSDKLVERNGKFYSYDYKKYIGTLKIAFKDCPQIFPEIDQMTLDRKSLIDITKKYHVCTGSTKKCTVYAKKLMDQ